MLQAFNLTNKDKVSVLCADICWWRTWTYSKWVNV
ncbi:Trp operon leader peptide [Vibrio genomosp. F10]|nr:Trp operon leader peptide [Vibrio genomosp. F10]